ncbi:MAG TPA: hypothetical protein VGP95_05060, partial [Gemmatimonadaceae bacterium]|nr:hypothetical protein [Gemmatimonadaceae bacterium]
MAEPVLEELRQRLARARWIDEAPGGGWEHGLDVGDRNDRHVIRAILRQHPRRCGHVDQARHQQWRGSSDVPAAFAIFPKDLSNPPREWA